MYEPDELERSLIDSGRRRARIMRVRALVISVSLFVVTLFAGCAGSYLDWRVSEMIDSEVRGE